jgi:hypothetical protein
LVLQADAAMETQTVVPPLKASPMTVGPLANVAPGTRTGKTKPGSPYKPCTAGTGTADVAALAWAIGAALASAAMTATAEAVRLLI